MGREVLSSGCKIAVVAAFFTLWWAAYIRLNAIGSASPRAVYFTSPTAAAPELFLSWTAVVYTVGGAVLPLLPLIHYWSWPRLGLLLLAYSTASAVAFACYWLWPVCILRPSYEGEGIGLWLMRRVIAVDGAANCTPSSHAIFAVLPATLISWRVQNIALRASVWAAAAAVCAATVTTGQHYYLDPVAGAATALAAAYLARLALLRRAE